MPPGYASTEMDVKSAWLEVAFSHELALAIIAVQLGLLGSLLVQPHAAKAIAASCLCTYLPTYSSKHEARFFGHCSSSRDITIAFVPCALGRSENNPIRIHSFPSTS